MSEIVNYVPIVSWLLGAIFILLMWVDREIHK